MKKFLLAERYARALSLSVPDVASMERAVEGLDTLVNLYDSNPHFRQVLLNPAISKAERLAVVGAILEHEHIEVDQVKQLFREMLRRSRIDLIHDVATVFSKLVDARLNQTQARVSSARELTEEQRARVEASLETYTGKKIHALFSVQPRLLGGVRAEVDGVVIDGTTRSHIRRLRDAILAD